MSYDNIKLEKGLYTTERTFTQELEALDPTENYKGTSLGELDAFERQLKRYNISVSGPSSDTVSKFFNTTDSAVLFPEYISRSVRQGMLGSDKVESIIAATTMIDGLDYHSIALDGEKSDYYLDAVAEGSELAELTIGVKDNLTELQKYGKIISASYEAIKFQKLDILSIALKRIGESISNSQFASAIDAITAGDIETVHSLSGVLTYEDLVRLWVSFEPYNMTTMIANSTTLESILSLAEFRDADAGLDFHATGKLITPFGAQIICYDNMDDGQILALDKNYAVEKVVASDVTAD
ncbi:MAG: phage major capsid protein [Clostridiales bacterium]|nr:phage major capsid protein [Clostridiales bacterium]